MILANDLLNAVFIERVNRYLAIVLLDKQQVEAFIPNPGRMKELLISGINVLLREIKSEKRKTAYDLVVVEYNNINVCIDSMIPNKFLFEILSQKRLSEFAKYTNIRKEAKFKNSRFDFFLSGYGNGCFIEAKSCTLVENNIALFPDAPTKRGSKHMHELVYAIEEGYEAYVIIVIQRNDAKLFKPNVETDPEFAEAIKYAVSKGVKVIAISTIISSKEIHFYKQIEVII
ncbi:MAG: DNA/RNA nuclease SfsA [Spirochaetota bacterium]|nr:DNA/RNA nuclease SfsA [Spirochaetota bacterium]